MTTYEQDLTQILKGQDPNDVKEAIGRHLRDIENERQNTAKSQTDNIRDMTLEQLETEFSSYDSSNPDYRYNINHPEVKRHNAIAAELTRKERLAHAQSQEITMDKDDYAKQEARRAIIEIELNNLRSGYGGTVEEQREKSKAINELHKETDSMIKPARLTTTEPPEPPEPTTAEKKDAFWAG